VGYFKNMMLTIKPKTKPDCVPVKVFCDMKLAGLTVIMRRHSGLVDFYRNWTEYKRGFGEPAGGGEYWLGNDLIHYVTTQFNYSLRIDMEDWSGAKRYATYDFFQVKSEEEGYELMVSGYKGDAGDSLSNHNGKKFSTYDVDNDEAPVEFWNGNCAARFHGAWWYTACYRSNLNGRYYKETSGAVAKKKNDGVSWNSWLGNKYSLKMVEMKLKRIFPKK
jgi:hypothetical protein